MHGQPRSSPEPIIVRWSERIPRSGTVLDVAAGNGRHAIWFAERGHSVAAVDRDTAALQALRHPNVRILTADLENAPWPLPGERFDVVVVVNYLWRPLLPTLIAAVAVGGCLLYETFASGNEQFGRPRNPDFLLQEDELRLAMPAELTIVEAWQGTVGEPPRAVRQRLFARRTR